MRHNSVVSGYPKSTGILRINVTPWFRSVTYLLDHFRFIIPVTFPLFLSLLLRPLLTHFLSLQLPTPALPLVDNLPIALLKGNRSISNPHPIYNFLSYHRLSSPYSAFVFAISFVSFPKNTNEALSHMGWRQAMVDEMTAALNWHLGSCCFAI